MENAWKQIEQWLQSNIPSTDILNPAATEEQICAAEREMQISFPSSFRSSLLIHNGQVSGSPGLFDGFELLSLERCLNDWNMWTGLLDDNAFADFTSQPQPAIRNDWFNKLWIPITYDRSFNNFCIDLAPTDYGSEGQIITLWHDSPEREIVAMSFDSFLTAFAQDLQDGIYTYSPIEHGVFRADGSRATESDCPVSKLSYLQQEALIARAKEYMNNSDWMEAIYCFELAFARGVVCFREEEKCAHALDLNNCAWSHAQLSRFEEALPLINMSVKYGEKLVPRQKAYIYGTRGFIHLNLKRYAHAIADFSEALRLKPDHGFAYWYRGEAYERSGKQDRALADKEQALKASFAPPV